MEKLNHNFDGSAQRSTGQPVTSHDVNVEESTKPAVKIIHPLAQGAMKQQ